MAVFQSVRNTKISQAVSIANQLVTDLSFYDQIAAYPGFTCST
ncbi:MAG TPA: hypothetical protein VK625_02340 [Flavitalea sp.]|nr:hypothetical protein [Flavitalea sp.]